MDQYALSAPWGVRIDLLDAPTCVGKGLLSFSVQTATRITGCRVVVAEGALGVESERYLYDSGMMETTSPVGIIPKGLPDGLAVGRLYYARVSVQDTEGRESPLSEAIPFMTETDWLSASGMWTHPREDGSLSDFAFFRHDFYCDDADAETTDRIYLSVTALSPEPTRQYVYNVSINGEEVGVGPCRLGKTPEGQVTVRYATYDVTDRIRAGANVLAAVCYATDEHAFLCQLTAYDKAGMPHTITNTGMDRMEWRCLDGDCVYGKSNSIGTGYFTAHACNVDATLFPFGFDTKEGYGADTWGIPEISRSICEGDRLLLPDVTEPVRRYPAEGEVGVTMCTDGSLLVDLQKEIVGGLRLTLDNPTDAPVAITLDFAEQVVPDGAGGLRVKSPMNTSNCYRETWTLRPGRQTLETLSLMTYRYVRIAGLPAPLAAADVTGTELRKAFSPADSSLATDHALLADLWALTKHTVRVTTQDIYVDSQSRERAAYEGDLLINMLAAYATEASYAPARLTTDYLLGHRTWPADYLLCIIYAAMSDYMATGDSRLLAAWYETLKGNLFTDCMDETGLCRSPAVGASNRNAVLVDWPPSERDGYDMNAPYNTVLNAMQVRGLQDMASIALVLGKTEDAAAFARVRDALKAAMIDRLYDPVAGCFCDGLLDDGTPSPHQSQHATAYALNAGVYTDAAMADRMALSVFRDGKLHVSVYAAFFLLEGLYRVGRGDLANRLLLDEDDTEGARTWSYMIRRMGATITTEAWNQANKPNMTLSHPWGAAPAHMIFSGICGILPTSAGSQTVEICPSFEGIDRLDVTFPTILGPIRMAWSPAADKTHSLVVELPATITATVCLAGREAVEMQGGKRIFEGL